MTLEKIEQFRVCVPLLGRLPTDLLVVPKWVRRATPGSATPARRNVYVPPFRRAGQGDMEPRSGSSSRQVHAPLPNAAMANVHLQPRRQPRPAPAVQAPPPTTIAEAEARGMESFGIEDICPCNLDGHPCMLPLRCRYRKNIICTTHVSLPLFFLQLQLHSPSFLLFLSHLPCHPFPAAWKDSITDTS